MSVDITHRDEPRRPIRVTKAAEILGVTRGTVHKWIKSGKIPGYQRQDTFFYVDLDDVENFQMFQRVTPKSGAA